MAQLSTCLANLDVRTALIATIQHLTSSCAYCMSYNPGACNTSGCSLSDVGLATPKVSDGNKTTDRRRWNSRENIQEPNPRCSKATIANTPIAKLLGTVLERLQRQNIACVLFKVKQAGSDFSTVHRRELRETMPINGQ